MKFFLTTGMSAADPQKESPHHRQSENIYLQKLTRMAGNEISLIFLT